MAQGDDGPDPAPAVALAEQTRVYPMEKDTKPMEFPNASGQRVNRVFGGFGGQRQVVASRSVRSRPFPELPSC
jgi:hypothetical protein